MRASTGESVRVIDPGAWNVEPGPDFKGATVEVAGRRVKGDVEVHLKPSGWTEHGHASDPAYANVAFHVTWLPGPRPRDLPERAYCVSIQEAVSGDFAFSPDSIDVAAYPYAHIPDTPRPCAAVLSRDPDLAAAVLRAAGKRRIALKAARAGQALAACKPPSEALWRAVMAALGYKANTERFAALAEAVPAASLPRYRERALAILLGTARLLPDFDRAGDGEAAAFARRLAESWFNDSRDRLSSAMRPRSAGVRPANAPLRRLAAAAALASAPGGLPALESVSPDALRAFVRAICETARWPFFEKRLTFSSVPAAAGAKARAVPALLGPARGAALVANVFLPFAIASGAADDAPDWIPPEDLSQPMRLAAHRLLGRDHNPALYSSNGLLMQGLLQLHRDFCMCVHPDCSACPLARALAQDASERKATGA